MDRRPTPPLPPDSTPTVREDAPPSPQPRQWVPPAPMPRGGFGGPMGPVMAGGFRALPQPAPMTQMQKLMALLRGVNRNPDSGDRQAILASY